MGAKLSLAEAETCLRRQHTEWTMGNRDDGNPTGSPENDPFFSVGFFGRTCKEFHGVHGVEFFRDVLISLTLAHFCICEDMMGKFYTPMICRKWLN